MKSPRHGLTAVFRKGSLAGWSKSVQGSTRWIVDAKRAPTGEAADLYYEGIFKELWTLPDRPVTKRPTINQILNSFLSDVKRRGLHDKSVAEYEEALQDFLDSIRGSAIYVNDLTPAHFANFVAGLRGRFGLFRLKKWMVLIRSAFNWASESQIIDRLPVYGPGFELPDRAEFRRKRAREAPRMYTVEEVGKLIVAARQPMRAMILLALNGGLGNTDISGLLHSHIDGQWVNYPRPKTGIRRRFPLWPETIQALATIKPKPEQANVFLTASGSTFLGQGRDQIAMVFAWTARRAGITCRGFYALRHTHRTISDELADQRAAALIMGHETGDVASLYTERIADDRLLKLTEHVRSQLKISEACALDQVLRRKPRKRRSRRGASGKAVAAPSLA